MELPTSRGGLASFTAVAAGVWLIGCAADSDPSEGTGGGDSGTSSGVGSGSGGGTGVNCEDAGQCPRAPECQLASCNAGVCSTNADAVDTPCELAANRNGFCDGEGACVDCNDSEQCIGTDICVVHICVPELCANGTMDGDETDVDCGGADCAPCANGLACAGDADDCLSGFCDAGGTCAACSDNGDCAAAEYCDESGTCAADEPIGQACDEDEQCANNVNCEPVSGGVSICCDVACDDACRSCANVDTGVANGTCADTPEGAPSPRGECPDTGCLHDTCVAGHCEVEPAGTACGVVACNGIGGDFEGVGQPECGANGICDTIVITDCGAYRCDASTTPNVCRTACASQTQCDASNYCVGVLGETTTTGGPGGDNTCQPKKAALAGCVDDVECINGSCATLACN